MGSCNCLHFPLMQRVSERNTLLTITNVLTILLGLNILSSHQLLYSVLSVFNCTLCKSVFYTLLILFLYNSDLKPIKNKYRAAVCNQISTFALNTFSKEKQNNKETSNCSKVFYQSQNKQKHTSYKLNRYFLSYPPTMFTFLFMQNITRCH